MGSLFNIGFLPQYYNGVLYETNRSLRELTGLQDVTLYSLISEEPRILTIDILLKFLDYQKKLKDLPWKMNTGDVSSIKYAFFGKDNTDKTKFPQTYKGVRYLSRGHVAYRLECHPQTVSLACKKYGSVYNAIDSLYKNKYFGKEKRDFLNSDFPDFIRETYKTKGVLQKEVGVNYLAVLNWLKTDKTVYIKNINDFKKLVSFYKDCVKNGIIFNTVESMLDCCFLESNPDKSKFPQVYKGIKLCSYEHIKRVFGCGAMTSSFKRDSIEATARYYEVIQKYSIQLGSKYMDSVYLCFPIKHNGVNYDYKDLVNHPLINGSTNRMSTVCKSICEKSFLYGDSLNKYIIEYLGVDDDSSFKTDLGDFIVNGRRGRFTSLNINRNSCFWLLDILFINSISAGCSKFEMPVYSSDSENREKEFIQRYIKYRIKRHNGLIYEGLRVEECVFDDYYRCIENNKVTYYQDIEIMRLRLYFYKIGVGSVAEGVYASIDELLSFYNISILHTFNNSDDINLVIKASSIYPVGREQTGYVTKKQLLKSFPNASKTYIRAALTDKTTYVKGTKRISGQSIKIRVPIFNKREVVRYELRQFKNMHAIAREYKLCFSKSKNLSSKEIEKIVCDTLIQRQNNKVFAYGCEFSSLNELGRKLYISVAVMRNACGIKLSSSEEEIKSALEHFLFTKVTGYLTVEDLNKRLNLPNIEILGWSFKDEKLGYDYFKCFFKDEGKVRVLSGKELTLMKVNKYIESLGD